MAGAEDKTKKYSAGVTRLLSEKFPKFTRIQLCMVNNPEYGLDLSAQAKRYLRENGYLSAETRPIRKKANRVSARFDDSTWEAIKADCEKEGTSSMQEYIEKLIQTKLKGG